MVVITSGEHSYFIDPILKRILDQLYSVVRKDYDAFIVVSGRERFGKSTLAMQVAQYLDPTFNLDRVVFNPEQFYEVIKKLDKFKVVLFDEAHGSLNAKETMTSINRKLTQTFTEIGFKNLIVILVLPSFFELGKYAAIHRSSLLLNVYRRGKYGIYNYRKKKALYLGGKQFYQAKVKPLWVCTYTKYFPLDKKEYEKKKLESTTPKTILLSRTEMRQKAQRDKLIQVLLEKGMVTKEISQITGLDPDTISEIAKTPVVLPPRRKIINYNTVEDDGNLPISKMEID